MCLGGRRSRTPPPPDYTQVRKDIKTDTLAGYQQAADDYNAAVDIVNQQLAGSLNAANTVGGVLGGATIGSLWDDPNTEMNENILTNTTYGANPNTIQDKLAWATNTLNAIDMPERPVFAPIAYGDNAAAGGVKISDDELPTLNEINANINPAELLTRLGGYSSDINNLIADRNTEIGNLTGNYNQYVIDTANRDYDIGLLGISDLGGIQDTQRELNTHLATLGTYGSPIQNQVDLDGDGIAGNEYGKIQGQFTSWNQALQNLLTEREKEQTRISEFEQGIYDDLETGLDNIDTYTYRNTSEIGALEQLIREKERDARRFSSELDFDFSGAQGELDYLKGELKRLRGEGAAESNRVNQFVTGQNQGYATLYGNAMNQGIYSKAGIDALQTAYDKLGYDTQNFSGWGYDPSNVSGGFYKDLIAPQITALQEGRKTALDNIESAITGSTAGLENVNLWDEGAINDFYREVQQAGSGLEPFSGGRVDAIQQKLTQATRSIDQKLQELSAYRNKLEEDAQEFLSQIQDGSYYSLDDLNAPDARAKMMEGEIKQYQAQQAMDEIEIIMEQLLGQRQRLEIDAQNVLARTQNAQQGLQYTDQGVPTFGRFASVDPISSDVFARRYQNTEEDEENYLASSSPFSTNLNAITIR